MKTTINVILFISLVVLMVACSEAGAGDPAETVEKYMQAKVEGDVDGIRALLCSEMEQFLERESNTFATVTGASVEDMECTADGDGEVVRCTGKIVALYGAEEQEFPLVAYRTVQEAGEWKWCGEAP
jgi:ketosteroid isomerase-like protein